MAGTTADAKPATGSARRDVHGILLLDKPLGISSNRALQTVKRLYRARKAGHTGSLDPQASGMLPLCFGDATRLSQLLLDADKTYMVRAALGARSATGDSEGELLEHASVPDLDVAGWQAVGERFVGDIEQVPPMYSALKSDGKRLYQIARSGGTVVRQPRRISIRSLSITAVEGAVLSMTVTCSKGTYIRTLVEDLARAAGTLAWTAALRRTAVVPFDQPMFTLEQIEAAGADASALDALLLAPDAAIAAWPMVRLAATDAVRFCQGQRLAVERLLKAEYRCYGQDDRFLGTAACDGDAVLRPTRVMTQAQHALATKTDRENRD